MSEDEVRAIVREEIAQYMADKRARENAASAQWWAKHREDVLTKNAPLATDGPTVSAVKAIFREGVA